MPRHLSPPHQLAIASPLAFVTIGLAGFLASVAGGSTVIVEQVSEGMIVPAVSTLPEGRPGIRMLGDGPRVVGLRDSREAHLSGAKGDRPADTVLEGAGEASPRWRLRLDYFQGTDNGFGEIFIGDVATISQNGWALSLGYVLVERLWDLPLDLIVQGSVMYHDEKGFQDDFLQYTGSLKAEWTSFPWNDCLRTRIGFASGWSYASKIPAAEVINRESSSSKHLLHYLEPSLSLNGGDLFRLMQLDHILSGFNSSALDHTWIVGSIYHRSGAWGFYGKDNNGDEVNGASNYVAIGIQAEF
jgi:hypothetical protein